ncbi:hypothetical protein Cagg_1319 [Chloroflexus aggregans DSM 9485]|uniref:Uncharacterized protein n=1 Tax=Chloroflexus aggregans (strain MD-66 / DSM 9485) TaxID=326427 RepID=B8G8G4_CHLAD|nr:hypothetical protein Cagg_1319 [Chloroflexus aggregans DSM 9485]
MPISAMRWRDKFPLAHVGQGGGKHAPKFVPQTRRLYSHLINPPAWA